MFDIIVFIIIALYALKGYKKGGIFASFQFVGYFAAFIVAFLFSGKVSSYCYIHLNETNVLSAKLLPFLTYILLFFSVIFLFRFIAKSIKSLNKVLMLGWLDRLIGAAIYVVLVLLFGGVLIWLSHKVGFIDENLLTTSTTATLLLDIGNVVIENIGKVVPFIEENATNFIDLLDKMKLK